MKETVEITDLQTRRAPLLRLRRATQLWQVEPQRRTAGSETPQDNGGAWVLPTECANCGGNAGAAARCEMRLQSLLVPYCARCFRSLEREKTQLSVAIAAAMLLGLTLLLVLPWVGLNLSLLTYVSISVVGVLLPLAWLALIGGVTANGQTTSGAAIWYVKGALVGTNEVWMRQLAERNAATLTPVHGRRPTLSWGVAVLPISVVAVAPAAYATFFPTLVVLNLAATDVEFLVDGRVLERIPVTSLESADAGKRFSLAAGSHLLEARAVADGTTLEQAQVAVDAGDLYLFAPGATGYCFWLERDTYGKAGADRSFRRLGGNSGFFRLPARIDSWFAANPEPGADARSSGGDMVALRHARCPDAPAITQ